MNTFQRFLGSELSERPMAQCRFHIVPVPFEATVSYGGGTANGPAAILEASDQLELWDGQSIPAEEGIYTHPAVRCVPNPEITLTAIESATDIAAGCGIPMLLGGEHTVTLGALRALKKRHGTFGIIQFDAHADLRDSYEGTQYSHACVIRRAVDDLHLPVFQLGVRALCEAEVNYRATNNIPHIDAHQLYREGIPEQFLPEDFPEHIYITFDVDGLDPSVISATGTPVPGGISWWDAMTLLERSIAGRTVIGADIVELAPAPGDHASTFSAAQLTYNIMGIIQRMAT